jgi:twitching motility two-component system response regulator PilH
MAKILVIDDSPSEVLRIRGVLELAGYEVDSMDMIIHLPQQVKNDPPDVILLDLSMPVLSGINVASLIRRHQPRPIPIVVYSSRPQVELRSAAAELGAVAYLQKGRPDDQLLGAVARATDDGSTGAA